MDQDEGKAGLFVQRLHGLLKVFCNLEAEPAADIKPETN